MTIGNSSCAIANHPQGNLLGGATAYVSQQSLDDQPDEEEAALWILIVQVVDHFVGHCIELVGAGNGAGERLCDRRRASVAARIAIRSDHGCRTSLRDAPIQVVGGGGRQYTGINPRPQLDNRACKISTADLSQPISHDIFGRRGTRGIEVPGHAVAP